MADQNLDRPIREHIEHLVKEEHRLHGQKWDLLRQRRALREFGDDPDQARVRPADVVEKYEQ